MEPIDRFAESYLAQWERLATVRRAPRYALAPGTTADELFPERLQPLCLFPEVIALGPDARRFLLIQACYALMNEITLLEVDAVSRLATDVANRPHRVALSPAVRQVALTVAIDEAYHAFAAREFMAQVEAATALPPQGLLGRATLEAAIAGTLAVTADELRDDVSVVMLCIAENTVTAEIFGMTEDTPPDNPFHIVSAEHLVDERRHSGYFQRLLAHYWAGLDEPTREAVGAHVPGFMTRFLEGRDWVADSRALLGAAGAGAAIVDAVMGQFATMPYRRSDHPMARNAVRFLERTGLLAQPSIHAALHREGWIEERFPRRPAEAPAPTEWT